MCVCVCLCVFTQQNCLSAKINQPTATPWGWGSSRRDHDLREASLALLRAAVPSSMATVAQTTGSCPATTGVPDFKSFLNFSRDCSMVTEKKKSWQRRRKIAGAVEWVACSGHLQLGSMLSVPESSAWQAQHDKETLFSTATSHWMTYIVLLGSDRSATTLNHDCLQQNQPCQGIDRNVLQSSEWSLLAAWRMCSIIWRFWDLSRDLGCGKQFDERLISVFY